MKAFLENMAQAVISGNDFLIEKITTEFEEAVARARKKERHKLLESLDGKQKAMTQMEVRLEKLSKKCRQMESELVDKTAMLKGADRTIKELKAKLKQLPAVAEKTA